MKSLTFITFVVPEKIATFKFFPRLTGRPAKHWLFTWTHIFKWVKNLRLCAMECNSLLPSSYREATDDHVQSSAKPSHSPLRGKTDNHAPSSALTPPPPFPAQRRNWYIIMRCWVQQPPIPRTKKTCTIECSSSHFLHDGETETMRYRVQQPPIPWTKKKMISLHYRLQRYQVQKPLIPYTKKKLIPMRYRAQ